jgi:hypothetical protein
MPSLSLSLLPLFSPLSPFHFFVHLVSLERDMQKRGKNKYKKKAIEKEQTEIEREGENF